MNAFRAAEAMSSSYIQRQLDLFHSKIPTHYKLEDENVNVGIKRLFVTKESLFLSSLDNYPDLINLTIDRDMIIDVPRTMFGVLFLGMRGGDFSQHQHLFPNLSSIEIRNSEQLDNTKELTVKEFTFHGTPSPHVLDLVTKSTVLETFYCETEVIRRKDNKTRNMTLKKILEM